MEGRKLRMLVDIHEMYDVIFNLVKEEDDPKQLTEDIIKYIVVKPSDHELVSYYVLTLYDDDVAVDIIKHYCDIITSLLERYYDYAGRVGYEYTVNVCSSKRLLELQGTCLWQPE